MTKQEVSNWLIDKIAEEGNFKTEEINTEAVFESFNLDSLSLVSISYDLENYTGKTIDPTVFGEYKSIDQLSEWVTKDNN